ncbi:MAG: hypothetical protein J2P54_22080 [Bradyrhizobiaceae bacterium]|nr:hypothetical protein [Bradyrhizobiaceae bacterium]
MSDKRPASAEQPRSEPEIIPPGSSDGWQRGRSRPYFRTGEGTNRIYVTRLGPFSTFLLVAAIAVVAALLFIVLLGAFLVWIPIIGLVLAIAIITGLLRGYFRRL